MATRERRTGKAGWFGSRSLFDESLCGRHHIARVPALGFSAADLDPNVLAVMHGPSVTGDCKSALLGLADDYERRLLSSTGA